MIHTSKQLKDKVRNISKSDPRVAQALLRNFIMERFLERVSVSRYKELKRFLQRKYRLYSAEESLIHACLSCHLPE